MYRHWLLPHTGIVRRADVNKPVANAYSPKPAPDNLAGPADVKYKIEYIDVFDAHIGGYHSVIENYDSIAKKRLVAGNGCTTSSRPRPSRH
jgi:hypothetical protein